MRWEPLRIEVVWLDDDTKESSTDIVELERTGPEFETCGDAIDKVKPPMSGPWAEEGTELEGREDVMLVDTDCEDTGATEVVEDLTPNTELRTGDGCGTELP